MEIKKNEILIPTKGNHRRTPGSDAIFQLEDEIIQEQNIEQSELLEDTNSDDELVEHIASIQAEAAPQTTTPQTVIPVQPRAAATSSQLFGTSVPIVIPLRMAGSKTAYTYVPPASNQFTTTVDEENDISFDVPLSSTRRIKGTL